MGSCETRELKFDRSRAVKGAEDKAISGISTLFYFQSAYDAAKVFFGIRVFAHRGIGPGRFYPSADCAKLFAQVLAIPRKFPSEGAGCGDSDLEGVVGGSGCAVWGARIGADDGGVMKKEWGSEGQF